LQLFAERGFRETTADDIAAAVGVTRRTFFLHFNSKDEVLLGIVSQQLDRLRAELERAPAELEAAARVWHAVANLADSMQQRGDLLLRLDLLRRAPELLAANLQKMTGFESAISAAVQRWRSPASPADPPDPSKDGGYALLVGTVTIAALRTALAIWQGRGGQGSLSGLFLEQVERLQSGLA
jgi:AcrR family transcriptional regulator